MGKREYNDRKEYILEMIELAVYDKLLPSYCYNNQKFIKDCMANFDYLSRIPDRDMIDFLQELADKYESVRQTNVSDKEIKAVKAELSEEEKLQNKKVKVQLFLRKCIKDKIIPSEVLSDKNLLETCCSKSKLYEETVIDIARAYGYETMSVQEFRDRFIMKAVLKDYLTDCVEYNLVTEKYLHDNHFMEDCLNYGKSLDVNIVKRLADEYGYLPDKTNENGKQRKKTNEREI